MSWLKTLSPADFLIFPWHNTESALCHVLKKQQWCVTATCWSLCGLMHVRHCSIMLLKMKNSGNIQGVLDTSIQWDAAFFTLKCLWYFVLFRELLHYRKIQTLDSKYNLIVSQCCWSSEQQNCRDKMNVSAAACFQMVSLRTTSAARIKPAGKVKGSANWWQKWLLHKWSLLMRPRPHHTPQFNKDKIMQITFLSDASAFSPFSRRSVAVIAVFWENCPACFWQLYFCSEAMEIWEGGKEKQRARRHNWLEIALTAYC